MDEKKEISKGELAVRKLTCARKMKDDSFMFGYEDPVLAMEARELEREAIESLETGTIQPLAGGEAVEADDEENSFFRETLKDPNSVSIGASLQRLRLMDETHSIDMAVDAAETIEAKNSLEKMLAHQMTSCHVLSMRLMSRAARFADNLNVSYSHPHMEQAVKVINAAARLMDTYQRGLSTLAKIRKGGQQKVTVEHVHVNAGGQAIVGNVMGGGGDKGGTKNEK